MNFENFIEPYPNCESFDVCSFSYFNDRKLCGNQSYGFKFIVCAPSSFRKVKTVVGGRKC